MTLFDPSDVAVLSLSYLLLTFSYSVSHGIRKLSPLTFFMAFYVIFYGPVGFFYLSVSEMQTMITVQAVSHMVRALTAANCTIAFLLPLNLLFIGVLLPRPHMPRAHGQIAIDQRIAKMCALFAIGFPLLITLIDPQNINRAISTWSAIFSLSETTLSYLRRFEFQHSAASVLISQTRYWISAFSITYLFIAASRTSGYRRHYYAVAGIVLLATAFVTTHKQTWILIPLCIFIAHLFFNVEKKGAMGRREIGIVLAAPLVIGAIITVLYMVQYASLGRPASEWLPIAFGRILGQQAILVFWFDFFSYETGFMGLAGMGPIADVVGISRREATQELPIRYMIGNPTTWQSGFIAYGWSVYGYIGVVATSAVVTCLVTFGSNLVRLVISPSLRAILCAIVAMSFWTLTQLMFHTALVTGGALLSLLLVAAIILYERTIISPSNRRAFATKASSSTSRKQKIRTAQATD